MDIVTGIDPLKFLGSFANAASMGNVSRRDSVKNFATIFYSEMLKQAFSEQSWSSNDESNSLMGSLTPLTQVFADKFAQELVKSGKYEELITKQLLMRGNVKW